MLSLFHTLDVQLREAMQRAFPDAKIELNPQLAPASKPEFGDFQANGALSLAKLLKQAPHRIAAAIVNQLQDDASFNAICLKPQIAGPGFINLTVSPDRLAAELAARLGTERLGVPTVDSAAPIVVDFSSPNIAKEMHVGHLRSTIIGDSLARVLEFRGYPVLRLNHLGDWGTQFGMLINQLKQIAPKALETADAVDLGDLVAFYREAKRRFDEDEDFRNKSRNEVVKLQSGDPVSLNAWSLLCDQSRREFQKVYDRLDIRLNERGESFYNPYLPAVIDDLRSANLLVTDDGAQCVFLSDVTGKGGNPPPMIVQKRDGGFNYATTDLAAIRYRFASAPNGDAARRVIYVTDVGQANHFAGVFQVATRAGWIPEGARLEHVPFGLVQGEDGKKLKTRSGDTVRLSDLLDEAVGRAEDDLRSRLKEEKRDETEEFVTQVASTVGLAAVKYADLSQNRLTNYQFSFDRMLAMQGNTAPYLLYTLVRIAGIARKAEKERGSQPASVSLQLSEPQEWALARELLKFDNVIIEVEEELLPNRLCGYLFELSQVFNRFYDQVPVLKAKPAGFASRLALCRHTADTLQCGLGLLGIPALERM
ncbi:arginine--tRNA ligase [Synechococcus sp. M16CYN]|uniref:arginine--tRNA ligase n=1 Tax=Synechococcus sp. M16CYN TaxID=3103139 RepID=UPI003342484A